MNCQCCDGKLKRINADSDFNNWNRKYHKKCWKDRNLYYNLYLKASQISGYDEKKLEYYRKRSCIV